MIEYFTFGGFSECAIERCLGVDITDISNPTTPVTSTIDWIVAGYSDGDLLDGKGNTLPQLRWFALDQRNHEPVTIYQNGNEVSSNGDGTGLPFTIYASAPETPIFVYNVPRVQGLIYDVYVIFSKPNGQDTIIDNWTVKIIGK